jgi:hypothetical protein
MLFGNFFTCVITTKTKERILQSMNHLKYFICLFYVNRNIVSNNSVLFLMN